MSVGTGNLSSNRATDSTHARITATGNTWGGASGIVSLYSQYGSVAVTDVQQLDDISTDSSGSWSTQTGFVSADKTILYRAKVTGGGIGGNGNTKSKKSGAVLATATTPTASSITGSSASIAASYVPNTLESTCTATLYYKKSTDAWPGTAFGTPGTNGGYGTENLSESLTGLDALTQYNVRLTIIRDTSVTADNTVYSSVLTFDTLAATPVLTTSAATSVTYKSATLNGTVNANGFSTVVTFVWGTTSGVYPNETGQVSGSPFSDSVAHNIDAAIVGLDPATTYYYKAKGVYNGTAYYGTENSFVSSAAPAFPEITTDPADQLAPTSARLNGTIRPYGNSSKYYFDWGTTTGYGSSTTKQGPSSSMSNVAFNDTITGLTDGVTYHFRAVAERQSDLGLYYGSDAEFTHTSEELTSSQEDQMLTFEYDRAYGVQSTVYFAVATPSGTGSNTFVSGITFAANDVKISKDGAQFVDVANLATISAVTQDAGNSPMYALVLTAAELSAEDVVVSIHDYTGGPLFRDALIHVRTKIQTGQLTVNADNIGTNTDAIAITPNGTGKGIDITAGDIYVAGKVQTVGNLAVGGNIAVTGDITGANFTLSGNETIGGNLAITGNLTAATIVGVLSSMILDTGTCAGYNASTPSLTLGASASTTGDTYNGAIVFITSGAGIGQCRTIVDYATTTKIATIDSAFATSPNACTYVVVPGQLPFAQKPLTELAGLPDIATATWGDMVKFLFQRFAYKRYQDATSQKLYKADSSTVLATGTFQDNTTDQTIGKLV